MAELLLDDRILWWVFVPIAYVTMAISVLRMYYGKYSAFKATKKAIKMQSAYRDHEQKNMMIKCDLLTRKYAYLGQDAFNSKRHFLCDTERGYLTRERQPQEAADPMASMQGMLEGMGGTLPMILSSIVTMGWISYSFGGILLAKMPFNLSQAFKSVTQSGIEMQSLSVQYISGTSFYLFIMFGMGQLFNLFFRDNEEVAQQIQNMNKPQVGKPGAPPMANPMMANPMIGMNGGMGMPQQQDPNQKAKQMFKSQIQNLSLVKHIFAYENCEKSASARLKKFLRETK